MNSNTKDIYNSILIANTFENETNNINVVKDYNFMPFFEIRAIDKIDSKEFDIF